jgi:folate-binding protein YgfZ
MPNAVETRADYQTAVNAGALYVREDRGLVEVTGADRATWLNNLVTNEVSRLSPGEGNYAFAANAKGRTVFDLDVLVLEDRLWLDVDRRWVPRALGHLQHYVIAEDVKLADWSAKSQRVAVLGPKAGDVVRRIGFGELEPMGQLQHVGRRRAETETRMVRHDFTGLPTAEFIVVGRQAEEAARELTSAAEEIGLKRIGAPAVEVLRIEAGIPNSVDDIGEEVLPPETGQVERGISHQKGCYLGQEIIERMRAHGAPARELVGARFDGDAVVAPLSILRTGEQEVGQSRSCCCSERLQAILALAYVKTAYSNVGTALVISDGGGTRQGTIVSLPVRGRE